MEIPCLICKTPATRVCKHPLCDQSPFFCDGPCIKKSSQLLHTHNTELLSIPINTFVLKVKETQKLKSQTPHQQHFERVKQKIIMVKQALDKTLQEHQRGLSEEIKLVPPDWGQQFYSRLNSESMDVKGKQIGKFMRGDSVFQNELTLISGIKFFKKEFEDILDQAIKSLLTLQPIKLRRQKANKLLQEGRILSEQKLFSVAVERYTNSLQFCPYTSSTHFNIGSCYHQLKEYPKATQSYLKCLQLNPCQYLALNNLGILYDKLSEYEKAVGYFTRAIDAQRSRKNGFKNRADTYVRMGREKQAIRDYERVLEIDPGDEEAKTRMVAMMRKVAQKEEQMLLKKGKN